MAEIDKGYEAYKRTVKARFGLKDIHIAHGHMRAADPNWKGTRPEEVQHISGMTDIVIVQDNATLTGAVRPSVLKEMIAEWEHQLVARPQNEDPRAFTRQAIAEHLALNRHREGDAGEILLCGAAWLACTNPQSGTSVRALLERGDVMLRYDILNNDVERDRRFRQSIASFN